jgi:hypothetical protein
MIGVAPPSIGSNTPGAPVQGYGTPGGAPAPTAPMGSVPDPNMAPRAPEPGVNPLGGTMVADANAFPGYAAPQQQQPQQPAPPAPDYGQPGAPPPQAPQYGQDPGIGQPPPGFGAPQGQPPGYGVDPSFQQGVPPTGGDQPYGGMQPGAMVPSGMQPGAMMPQGGYQYDDMPAPVPGSVGASNPVVTVLLIVLTCGIYGVYLLVKNKNQPQ